MRSHIHFEVTPLDTMSVLGASRAATVPDQADVAERLVERATRFLLAVASSTLTAVRACARPVTRDALPRLGPVPGIDCLFVAGGHGPYGITLGPASGASRRTPCSARRPCRSGSGWIERRSPPRRRWSRPERS